MTDQQHTIKINLRPILPVEQFPEAERALLITSAPITSAQIWLRDQRIQELERQLRQLTDRTMTNQQSD